MDDVDVPRMRVEADGADFVLTLPLPLVSAGMVGMARREDDLLLEVGGQRRVVTLPVGAAALHRQQCRRGQR